MVWDRIDRCGIWPLSTNTDDWMTPWCRYHDQQWVSQYKSFAGATKASWLYAVNRAEMLGKSKLKAAAYVAIGTFFGAPIWFGRKLWKRLK